MTWDTSFANVYVGQKVAQSFLAHSSFLLTHVELYVFDQPQSNPPDLLQISIAVDAGGWPGPGLGSAAQEGHPNWSWIPFGFYPWVPITAGQRYWIVASDLQPRPKGYEWAMNGVGTYVFGEATWYEPSSGTWANETGSDLFFRVYGISGPSLVLEVQPATMPVDPGTVVPIDLWFNNSGNEAADTATISMALSSELLYLGDDAAEAGGTRVASLSWSFHGVSVGAHHMSVWVQVDPEGTYYDGESLRAWVFLNYSDGSGVLQAPSYAVASVTVLVPVIHADVIPWPAHVDPGQTFNFTISFANLGSGRAAGLWLNATTGERLTLLGDDAMDAGGVSLGPASWWFGDVEGQTYAFNVTVRADPSSLRGDRLLLILDLEYSDSLGHPFATSRAIGMASIHGPSLVAEAAVDPPRVRPGEALQAVFYANNTGDEEAPTLWLNATLPSWAVLQSSQPTATRADGGNLTYQLSSLAPGPLAVALRLSVAQDAPPGASIDLSVHLDVIDVTGIPLRSSSASARTIVATPRFTLSIESTATSARPGESLEFTVRVNNSGNEAASWALLAITLPDKTVLLDATLPWTETNGTKYAWRFSEFGPGERAVEVRLEVSTRLAKAETLVIRAELTYERADGQQFSGGTAFAVIQGLVDGASFLESVVLWIAVLAALFMLFLLLAYMDFLPHRRAAIDDVFLLHNSGILICHYSTSLRPDVDSDIASGMLMAVRNFVADALRSKNGVLQELRYGDYRIHMAHGRHAILVVFSRGKGGRNLDQRMAAVLRNIETAYGEVLESWSGRTEDFRGVEDLLLDLVQS